MDKDMNRVMEKLIDCRDDGLSPSEALKKLEKEGEIDNVLKTALAMLLSGKPIDAGNAVDMEVDLDD